MQFQSFTDRSGEKKQVFIFLRDCVYSKEKGAGCRTKVRF